jgi:hypothetical protein
LPVIENFSKLGTRWSFDSKNIRELKLEALRFSKDWN